MKKKDKKVIKLINIYGVVLIIAGILLTSSNDAINFIFNNNLNLNIKEYDTNYGGSGYDDNITTIAYTDNLWLWPTDKDYYLTSTYSYYHPAIDIISNNHNIYSSFNGTVVTNSYKSDNGNYLVIKQDNGYYVLYAHLSQKLVSTNQKVKKGQLIGIMGATGNATGIHLHFSVWDKYPYQSKSIDPLSFY